MVHEGAVPLRLEPALARGLPARRAARRRVRLAAAARPPGDLGVPGCDDGADDARDDRDEAGRVAGASGERPDRLVVTTILLSAAGAPGAARLIRALQDNGERRARV